MEQKQITLTKEQYENLVKMVYLGDWMINSIRVPEEEIKEFSDLEQYVYSFSKDFGMKQHIEFDGELKKYFPTMEFEEGEMDKYKSEYDEEGFWEELVYSLATRDFLEEYGKDTVKNMSNDERMEKMETFENKYWQEVENQGIKRLKISG